MTLPAAVRCTRASVDKALKLAPRGMGPPTLLSLRETVTPSGGYALSMAFSAERQSLWTSTRSCTDAAPADSTTEARYACMASISASAISGAADARDMETKG